MPHTLKARSRCSRFEPSLETLGRLLNFLYTHKIGITMSKVTTVVRQRPAHAGIVAWLGLLLILLGIATWTHKTPKKINFRATSAERERAFFSGAGPVVAAGAPKGCR